MFSSNSVEAEDGVNRRYLAKPMFGIMKLETQFAGCRFAIGIRNAHDKVHAGYDRGLPVMGS